MRRSTARARISASRRLLAPQDAGAHIGQGLPAPQPEGLVEQAGLGVRVAARRRPVRLLDQPGEPVRVDPLGVHAQQVSRRLGDDGHIRHAGQRPADPQHVPLEGEPRARRRVVPPDPLGEFLRRHHPVGAQDQGDEQGTLFRRVDPDPAFAVDELERAEKANIHRGSRAVGGEEPPAPRMPTTPKVIKSGRFVFSPLRMRAASRPPPLGRRRTRQHPPDGRRRTRSRLRCWTASEERVRPKGHPKAPSAAGFPYTALTPGRTDFDAKQ
ncbi:hypothetical protein GCM10029978_088680 [Actinoallomurus acanthiterrae]